MIKRPRARDGPHGAATEQRQFICLVAKVRAEHRRLRHDAETGQEEDKANKLGEQGCEPCREAGQIPRRGELADKKKGSNRCPGKGPVVSTTTLDITAAFKIPKGFF